MRNLIMVGVVAIVLSGCAIDVGVAGAVQGAEQTQQAEELQRLTDAIKDSVEATATIPAAVGECTSDYDALVTVMRTHSDSTQLSISDIDAVDTLALTVTVECDTLPVMYEQWRHP